MAVQGEQMQQWEYCMLERIVMNAPNAVADNMIQFMNENGMQPKINRGDETTEIDGCSVTYISASDQRPVSDHLAFIATLGLDGWEMVSAQARESLYRGTTEVFYFKRPVV